MSLRAKLLRNLALILVLSWALRSFTSSYFTPEGAFRASEAAANYGPSTVAYVAEDGGTRWFLARYLDSWSFVPISRRGPFWTFGSRATLSMDDSRPVQAYFGDGLSDAVLYGYRADPAVEALEFRFQTEGGARLPLVPDLPGGPLPLLRPGLRAGSGPGLPGLRPRRGPPVGGRDHLTVFPWFFFHFMVSSR